jgi:cyanophycinase-like exopeptidase
MANTLALIGGAEFLSGDEAIDRYLIARAGGAMKTRGVIIPTAAVRENPNLATRNGTRWFESLGATMQAAMIVDQASANDAANVEMLERANFFYLLGGDPRYLLDTLRDSKSWDVIAQKYRAGDAVVAGSSAGAMVLCKWMTDFHSGFVPALDLAPVPCAVAPHFARGRALSPPPPDGARWLGIAEKTGAVFEGNDWVVIGPGKVTIIESNGERKVFANGERFKL